MSKRARELEQRVFALERRARRLERVAAMGFLAAALMAALFVVSCRQDPMNELVLDQEGKLKAHLKADGLVFSAEGQERLLLGPAGITLRDGQGAELALSPGQLELRRGGEVQLRVDGSALALHASGGRLLAQLQGTPHGATLMLGGAKEGDDSVLAGVTSAGGRVSVVRDGQEHTLPPAAEEAQE